jgi:anthranilate phosphoribosyltransferase
MSFEDYLETIKKGEDLHRADAAKFLAFMLDDQNLSETQIAEALTALTKKSPTVDEVCGFIDSMQARMTHLTVPAGTIDTCGTGGDKSGTFNISTAAAMLLAADGVKVAKHGNRAATSKCGSPDVLEALGIPVDLRPEAAAKYLMDHDFVFLFAQLYHPALKRLAIVRKQLGFATVFNLLGPLLNPAGVKRQVVGTFSLANAKLLAQVMARMNYEHAIVLTSEDGLDEASLAAPVHIFEIKDDKIAESTSNAADFGLESAPISDLQGSDAAQNAHIITTAFEPTPILTPSQRVIVFNAGLGFYVSSKAATIEAGVKQARGVLMSGQALAKLQELRSPA